jgi:ParB-like chromosome segregation protein Spo0J
VLQPLLVTPQGLVVAGHRRLAAARLAGLEVVPVLVRHPDPGRQQEIMLVEKLQRQGLLGSPAETVIQQANWRVIMLVRPTQR